MKHKVFKTSIAVLFLSAMVAVASCSKNENDSKDKKNTPQKIRVNVQIIPPEWPEANAETKK